MYGVNTLFTFYFKMLQPAHSPVEGSWSWGECATRKSGHLLHDNYFARFEHIMFCVQLTQFVGENGQLFLRLIYGERKLLKSLKKLCDGLLHDEKVT